MSRLPDVHELAKLISSVTETMCGTTFVPGDPLARGESLCGRMVMLPIEGEKPGEPKIHVVLASDSRGSRALGSAMFGCAAGDLTQDIIDDAIRELLNMVAGQLSRAMQLEQPLGLPRLTTLAEMASGGGPGLSDAVLLRSRGNVDLRLWIFEAGVVGGESAAAVEKRGFRSLLRRIVTRS